MVTWEQTSSNATRNLQTNDDMCQYLLADSSLTGLYVGSVTWNFNAAGSSGTIYCCQWSTLSDLDVTSAQDAYDNAEHVFGQVAATSASGDVTFSSTSSVACTATTRIGLVILNSGSDNTVINVQTPKVSGYQQGFTNTGGASDDVNYTSRFSMTTGAAPSGGGTRLPPPPLVVHF